mmetsp:Transcript_6969/g.21870  ORF Transcript_6969/g.21870 Transcript_6969/m.21870 type:complete len:166 (-) Transcript_6969:903-1400(-)
MSALLFIASAGLVLPAPPQRAHAARRAAPTTMLDIPRITLPAAVADPIKDLDLKSPNDLSQAEYNSYSAAAIGGTLIFFILPLFDILGFFGDFVFSALVGGGVGATALQIARVHQRRLNLGREGSERLLLDLDSVRRLPPLANHLPHARVSSVRLCRAVETDAVE